MKTLPIPPALARSDHELLAAIATGDLEPLGELFERHEPAIRRYVARLGVHPGDVDDLVQATFLDVVPAATRFDSSYAPRRWLFGIATVMVRRHRRSLRYRAMRIAAWAGIADREAAPTPAQVFERDDAARRLAQALERLSPKKREVFVLVTLEGLSGQEAASTLGIPLQTVWTRLHHARIELLAATREGES